MDEESSCSRESWSHQTVPGSSSPEGDNAPENKEGEMKGHNALLLGAHNLLQAAQSKWIDMVVQAATIANELCTANPYVDMQVEFESRQEALSCATTSSIQRLWMRTTTVETASMEQKVELYRHLLFDEDAVLDALSHQEVLTRRPREWLLSDANSARGYDAMWKLVS
jgi:hypothetical protein